MPDLSFVLCVLIGDDDPEGSNPRDIRVRARGGGLWRISDAHCAYDPLHFVLFHPHREPGWHPNITGATFAVVDELSSEDDQHNHLKMSSNLMWSQQWTPGVVKVGVGVGARDVVRVRVEIEALLQGGLLARLLPGNTRLISCMTVTLPPTARSLMARGYIKSGWLTSTPRSRGSGCGGCA